MTALALTLDQLGTPVLRPFRASPELESLVAWLDTSVGYSEIRRSQLFAKLRDAIASAADNRVDPNAVKYAVAFLAMLPSETPEPDVVIEEDGEVGFDWDTARRSTFSVSIGPDGTLNYGGIFGHRTRYGSDQLTSSIPSEILTLIADTQPPQSF